MLKIHHNGELVYSNDNLISISIQFIHARRQISLQFLDVLRLINPFLTIATARRAFNLFHIESRHQNFYDCFLVNYNCSTLDYTTTNSIYSFNLTFETILQPRVEDMGLFNAGENLLVSTPKMKNPSFNWKKEGF